MKNGLVVRNLSDQLVELVRDRILSGEVPADLPVRQDALAAQFGVSKIPLREALTRLEQEGLLSSKPNRGFSVRTLSTEEAEEVYALRRKLEPETVALAAANATDAEQREAIKLLETLNRVTDEHAKGVGACNRAFHLALIRPSRQMITSDVLERLHVLSERYVRKHLEPFGRDERANDEHDQLLETWLARDSENVAALMQIHIDQTLQDLRRQLGTVQQETA